MQPHETRYHIENPFKSFHTIIRLGRVQRGSSFYCIKSARQTDLIFTKFVIRFSWNSAEDLTIIR